MELHSKESQKEVHRGRVCLINTCAFGATYIGKWFTILWVPCDGKATVSPTILLSLLLLLLEMEVVVPAHHSSILYSI
jgi:hypothetical protein